MIHDHRIIGYYITKNKNINIQILIQINDSNDTYRKNNTRKQQ